MPDPTVPRIIAVSDRFRAELLAQERSAATRMVTAYGTAWRRILPEVEALTEKIEAARLRGEDVNPDWLRRQARYADLMAQTVEELARFASFADLEIQALQQQLVAAAPEHAQELTGQALPPGLTLRALAELGLSWNILPAESMIDLVGTLGDGSPLRTLLDAIPGNVGLKVGETLQAGVVAGWGPRKTADAIRQETGMGLSRALRISRTESLRSYRTASRRQYEANARLVPKWRRHAAKNPRTCLACLVLDGKEYTNQEDMDDHPNGRCAMLPVPISYRDLGIPVDVPPLDWEKGQTWFEKQPAAVQADMMGASLYQAWKKGLLQLEQLPKKHTDKDWGPSWTVASLKDLGIDWRDVAGEAAG